MLNDQFVLPAIDVEVQSLSERLHTFGLAVRQGNGPAAESLASSLAALRREISDVLSK